MIKVIEYQLKLCTYCWNNTFDIHCFNCRPKMSDKYSNRVQLPMDILVIPYTNLTPINIPEIKKNYYLEIEKQYNKKYRAG